MTSFHRGPLIMIFALMAVASATSGWAAETSPAEGATPAVVAEPSAATESAPTELLKPVPASETVRPRNADALIRALMVITSAGGNRPFPLVPR